MVEERQKSSYFGIIRAFMEEKGEILRIGDRFATYGMDNSHEMLANI